MAFTPSAVYKKEKVATEISNISPEEQKRLAEEEKILLEEERIYRRGSVSVQDLISPASMKIEPSYVLLGDKYVRTIFVVTYPRYITVGWFTPIVNLNTALDIGMFFYPVKAEIILRCS